MKGLFLHRTKEDIDGIIFGIANRLMDVYDGIYWVAIALEDNGFLRVDLHFGIFPDGVPLLQVIS